MTGPDGSPSAVVVVAAVVGQGTRLLVTCRPSGVHLEGYWEFPGGKVHPGETHAEALDREMREELDAGVEVLDLILETRHEYPDRVLVLCFYRCRLLGTPRPLLGQELRWVERDDLGSLRFPPADDLLIARLSASDAW
ncbi:MAG: (deoxy)nucleoside triphosphate pyrophosphohydrolase [Acidobacteria bacterium]|nr:(deoxy)nucleoside triphosphate pyrophosphohydrolase [Acidobacteriota bacterium]